MQITKVHTKEGRIGAIVIDPHILHDDEQRWLVKWIFENKPEIIRDIVCDSCPEVK